MKMARWLVIVGLFLAGFVVPLAAAPAALADGGTATFTGTVVSRPEGTLGAWTIGDQTVLVTENTVLVEVAGEAEVDATVYVVARQLQEGSLQATLIRVQQGQVPLLARLRCRLGEMQAMFSFMNQRLLALRTRMQAQLAAGGQGGYQLQAQQQSGVQTQTQTQAQQGNGAQNGAGERDRTQTRAQGGTCTQDQTQTLAQDQTQQQTRAQDGTGTQTQTQAQVQTQSQDQTQNQDQTGNQSGTQGGGRR